MKLYSLSKKYARFIEISVLKTIPFSQILHSRTEANCGVQKRILEMETTKKPNYAF